MKNILLIAALFIACTAQAGIKTDTVNNYDYVDIANVRVITDTACRMSIPAFRDNNKDAAVVYVVLYNREGSKVGDFNITIDGEDYAQWNANDPMNLYYLVAEKKGLQIK